MADGAERIKDVKAIRALAHPVRWQLLQLLEDEDSMTATRCAELTGESVASCSYHLNTLAKYGYIEQAEGGQGREKPWRATRVELNFSHDDDADIERSLAAEAASDVFIDAEAARMKRMIRRSEDAEPEEWRHLNLVASSGVYLTATEARELNEEMQALTKRYADRTKDSRPGDSRNVRLFLSMSLGKNPNEKK